MYCGRMSVVLRRDEDWQSLRLPVRDTVAHLLYGRRIAWLGEHQAPKGMICKMQVPTWWAAWGFFLGSPWSGCACFDVMRLSRGQEQSAD